MKKHLYCFLSPALLLILFFLITNCKTADYITNDIQMETPLPEELFFIAQTMPDLSIPAEIGGRSENPSEETGMIKAAFREAYAEALLRNINLKGLLGSDLVSPWPAAAPESWSQNWENAESSPNSWGIDNLVLALGSFEALSELSELSGKEKAFALVFNIQGPFLNEYGKSAGYNRANGVVGYGIPLGEPFYSDGTAVQRFSKGRIIVTSEGSRFSFEDDLFASMIENLSLEEINYEFGGKDIPLEVSNAFIYAWAYTFSETEGMSDGPIAKVSFAKPWEMETGHELLSIKGFYYKSYNNSHDVLVVIDCEQLPLRARLLYGPFLKAVLATKRLPGLEHERILGAGSGTGLGKSLADGFAVYGPPLTNSLPLPVRKIQEILPDAITGSADSGENQDILFLEAQRFARGWIIVKTGTETTPEIDLTTEEIEQEIDSAEETMTETGDTETVPETGSMIYTEESPEINLETDGSIVP